MNIIADIYFELIKAKIKEAKQATKPIIDAITNGFDLIVFLLLLILTISPIIN